MKVRAPESRFLRRGEADRDLDGPLDERREVYEGAGERERDLDGEWLYRCFPCVRLSFPKVSRLVQLEGYNVRLHRING